MLRVGIVGLGFMGRAHLANYLRLESEGVGVKLVSVCDIDEAKLKGQGSGGNINVGSGRFDLSKYAICIRAWTICSTTKKTRLP